MPPVIVTSAEPIVTPPATILVPTVNVPLENVKLALSLNNPPVLANTTRPLVNPLSVTVPAVIVVTEALTVVKVFVPVLYVKLVLSLSMPLVPAKVTRPLVNPLSVTFVNVAAPALIVLPMLTAPLIPTPPVTTNVPLVVSVLAVFLVNVTAPLAANVVNAPLPRVVAPTDILSIVPAVVGLIVTVPLGLIDTLVLAVKSVNVPALAVVAPITTLSIAPVVFGLIVTVPVPVGCKLTVMFAPFRLTAPVAVNAPVPILPELSFPLTPTPPVTTNEPVEVSVLSVFLVNVTLSLAVNVVNAPVLVFVAPILVLLIVPPVIVTLLLVKLPRKVAALISPSAPVTVFPLKVASGINSKYPSDVLRPK